MKRRNDRTTVLWTCAILFSAGSYHHVLAGERSSPPNPSDQKIAALLTDIEDALMTGKMMSLDLSSKLIEARTLWPTASHDGRRMLKEFPDKLRNDQAQLSKDDDVEKSINLRVFGSVAAQYIENTTILNDREPGGQAAPQTDDQQQAAIAPQVLRQPPAPPPAPPQQAVAPPPVVTAPPQPAPSVMAPPPQRPSASTMAMIVALLNRGNAMLDIGDIAAARLLFQRAASLGSGSAAMKLARTYDPDFLGISHKVIGLQPDRATAAIWYRKAVALGEPQAQARLAVLVKDMSH